MYSAAAAAAGGRAGTSFSSDDLNDIFTAPIRHYGGVSMHRVIFAAAVMVASVIPPVSTAQARRPAPPSPPVCNYEWEPEVYCYFATQKECWAARRELHRDRVSELSACYEDLATGSWALRYVE